MSINLMESRKYINEGFSNNPPFKGFGVKFLQCHRLSRRI